MIGRQRIQRRALPSAGTDWPASLHPVLRRVFASRGIVSAAEIEHRLASLLAPTPLGGIARACELIEDALRNDTLIVIVGDFDAAI